MLGTFPGMFEDIPRSVWRGHSRECLETLPGMFEDIPRNARGHSPEYLKTFTEMFDDISRNITYCNSLCSPHSVPRSCILGFIHSPLLYLAANFSSINQNMVIPGSHDQNHCVTPRSPQPFTLASSMKLVPGISGYLVVKSKLPPRNGSSLEAVEPHP